MLGRAEKREVECLMNERRTSDGVVISGHRYREVERHQGCEVTVLTCECCGKVEVCWRKAGAP